MVTPTVEPAVLAEDLALGYGEEPVVEGVAFRVEPGTIFAIMGSSGSGKSTVLKAIHGRLRPMAGRLRVLGQDVGPETDEDDLIRLRRRLGVLFQTGGLLGSLSVGENLALPLEELTDLPGPIVDEIVRLKLAQVGLPETLDRMPSELSGGMARRVAFARAMILEPDVLLCDEPTAGLDPATARSIDALMADLNERLGITLVVVTHDLGTVENLSLQCILIDPTTRGVIASGDAERVRELPDERVRDFFRRRLDPPRPAGAAR